MQCQYCNATLENDMRFCPKCGKSTDINPSSSDPQAAAARSMAARFLVVGIICSVGAFFNFALTTILALASEYIDSFDKLMFSYTAVIIFYTIIGISFTVFAAAHFVERHKILKNGSYSANKVVSFSAVLCVFIILRVILNINIDNPVGIIFLIFSLAAIGYEIVGILAFTIKNRKIFRFELPEIPEAKETAGADKYTEQPSEWDNRINDENIVPVDENGSLYRLYMDYRKDRLEDILNNPQEYRDDAVNTAKYVFFKRYGG